jgi:glycosyltransferase involved in cell wall biosynthesis
MRITIVQGAFLPVPPILGGETERIWHELGREFARRGHDVLHISRRHPKLPYMENTSGVRHFRVRGFGPPRSFRMLRLEELLYALSARRFLIPADIIVSHARWLPRLVRSHKYGRMVVPVACFKPEEFRHCRDNVCLHASTQDMAAKIRAVLGHRSHVQVNVVPDPISRRPGQMPAPLNRSPVVLYVGPLDQDRGVDLLLFAWRRAAPHLPGWRLRIVGSAERDRGGGGVDYLDNLVREAGELPVDFVEPTADPAVLEREYRRASFFVHPPLAATGEAPSITPLEAMAFGLPIIVSRQACFHDFIVPEKNGLVFDHGDGNAAGELAERMVRLATEHELRLKIGTAAWETSANYTVSAVAVEHLAKFADLL